MSVVRKFLGMLAALVLIGHASAYTNGRLLHRAIEAENKEEVSDPSRIALANRILERILDFSTEIFREIGATGHEMEELKRKRNVITACYFQAVSCY